MIANTTTGASRRSWIRVSLVLACGLALSGCGTVRGWFDGKDDEPNEPASLVDITPSAQVVRLWSVDAGKGEDRLGARQGPVVADGRVYAAAVEGGVRAFDLQSGQSAWSYKSDASLSGGPGAGDGLVVVGGLEGQVIALDAATGAEKWTAKVPNEVIAAPVIGQGMVFVRSNDGRITAFDAASGERRWFWNRDIPNLTVRGNDAPTLGPGFVFVGNDDGSVVALSAADGKPLWEQAVGRGEGRSELERMSDVDGTPVLLDTTLFASSFKRQTVAIDAPSGRPLWSSEFGGANRVGVGSDRVVVSDPAGNVHALDVASGASYWQQAGLARRGVTGAAVQGEYAVVGDFDGYVHWLKLADGAFAARQRVGGDPLRAAPVVADGIVLVQSTSGELSAFRVQ